MISLQHVQRFLQKTPEQRRITVRFQIATLLAKVPYAPHRVHLDISSRERVDFWWSYFPMSFKPERGLFEYWDDDGGDLRFLWKNLRPGMTFLDVGAYHGLYSLIAAKKLGRGGKVFAFEPSPRERLRMMRHLRHNGVDSVCLESYALAATPGTATFAVVVSGYTTMNSLRPPSTDDPTKQIAVETTSFDAYLDQHRIETVDFVKIDAEGGELEAFRGAKHLLTALRPVVICEVLDLVTRGWGYAAKDIMSLLRSYGYEWFDVAADGSLRPHVPREEYVDVRNFVAVPAEKTASLDSGAANARA